MKMGLSIQFILHPSNMSLRDLETPQVMGVLDPHVEVDHSGEEAAESIFQTTEERNRQDQNKTAVHPDSRDWKVVQQLVRLGRMRDNLVRVEVMLLMGLRCKIPKAAMRHLRHPHRPPPTLLEILMERFLVLMECIRRT